MPTPIAAASPFPAPETRLLAEALRNFFLALNASGLQAASLALTDAARAVNSRAACPAPITAASGAAATIPFPPDPFPMTPAFWLDLEYEFNRLFVGPEVLPAPPYSSVYLDPEPVLMGPSTLLMRDMLHALGLRMPHEGREAEDHIACELEIWLILSARLAANESDGETGAASGRLLNWLEREHMSVWIPLFINRTRETGELSPPLRLALHCLEHWLHTVQRSSYA